MYDDARCSDSRERGSSRPEQDFGGHGGSGDARLRDDDPCDVFRRDLDLPDDRERVVVRHRDRSYRLNDDDVRAREDEGRVDRLRDAGLVETIARDRRRGPARRGAYERGTRTARGVASGAPRRAAAEAPVEFVP